VSFLGQLHGDALVEQYRSCDVFCAPSIGHESFGITLLEAMAAGKPIVAARIPGYSDVVRNGEEALLYASTSAGDLRDALRRLVTDEGLRLQLAVRGLKKAQDYGWPRVAAAVAAGYDRLLRERC
jgi:phosphatidylinositol alpha-mannosyltransferase